MVGEKLDLFGGGNARGVWRWDGDCGALGMTTGAGCDILRCWERYGSASGVIISHLKFVLESVSRSTRTLPASSVPIFLSYFYPTRYIAICTTQYQTSRQNSPMHFRGSVNRVLRLIYLYLSPDLTSLRPLKRIVSIHQQGHNKQDIPQQLLDQINMRQNHSPATVSLESQLIKSFPTQHQRRAK